MVELMDQYGQGRRRAQRLQCLPNSPVSLQRLSNDAFQCDVSFTAICSADQSIAPQTGDRGILGFWLSPFLLHYLT